MAEYHVMWASSKEAREEDEHDAERKFRRLPSAQKFARDLVEKGRASQQQLEIYEVDGDETLGVYWLHGRGLRYMELDG